MAFSSVVSGILSGVLGGAGSAVGGIFGGSETKPTVQTQFSGLPARPGTDPLVAITSFDAMLSLGILDPTILTRASPLAAAIAEMSRAGFAPIGVHKRAINLINAFEMFRTDPDAFFEEAVRDPNLSSNIGLARFIKRGTPAQLALTVMELFQEEVAFRQRIEPILAKAQTTADEVFGARLDARSQLARLAIDLPDASAEAVETLQQQEEERLTRDINRISDEQRTDALKQAQFGGFNPGRIVGDIEEQRGRFLVDADVEARRRAIELITGQQTTAQNEMNLLQQFLGQPQQQAQAISSIRTAGTSAGTSGQSFSGGTTSGALGAGIGGGLVSAGDAITNFQLIQAIQALKSKPATGD